MPNDAGGILHGIPLGPVAAAAVLMLAWVWAAGRRLPGASVVAVILALTWLAGAAIPGEGGLRARYYANAGATGSHERSTEFPDAAFTRIDRRVDFSPDRTEFPLPFFNDNSRFNFYKIGEPDRRRLGFAVRWSGLWWVDEDRPRVYLDAPGSAAQVFVDGAEALTLTPRDGSPVIMEVPVTRGWHRLDLTYASAYGGPRRFSAGLMNGEARLPFGDRMVATQQIRAWQMSAARWLQRVKLAADVAVLASLAWIFATAFVAMAASVRRADSAMRERRVMYVGAAVAAAEAVIFALPWFSQNAVLIGGDDTMTYEGYARDILLNGILMNGGLPPGQGEPFYYQAFYPYFLAGMHYLFGESMFGPVLVQRLLAALTIGLLVAIAIELNGERTWVVALPIATAFVAWKFWPIAAQLLNESLYVPLLTASVLSLIHMCRGPRVRSALAHGALSGLATITRSTALLAWVVAWPVCWLAMRAAPDRRRVLSVAIATFLAIFSLIAIRNWIVAGVFAPTSTELGITLLGGNEIPPGMTIDLTPRAALYQRWGIADPTAMVVEYALTAPWLFAQNLGRKALFALGFYEPYAPGWGYSPVYIAVWTTAIAGLVAAWRVRERQLWVLLPALVAATQFIAVVMVYPKGERLIVPIHTLLVPYAAAAVWQLRARFMTAGRATGDTRD